MNQRITKVRVGGPGGKEIDIGSTKLELHLVQQSTNLLVFDCMIEGEEAVHVRLAPKTLEKLAKRFGKSSHPFLQGLAQMFDGVEPPKKPRKKKRLLRGRVMSRRRRRKNKPRYSIPIPSYPKKPYRRRVPGLGG